MKAPCKDCEKRHPSCHSHCEAYQAFCTENARRLEEQRKAKDILAYKHESRIRLFKKTKWRR